MVEIDEIVRRATKAIFDKPLITNVFRSVIIEAIVSAALPDWNWCSADYASCDFTHPDGTRLEVKQSAARQSWAKEHPSKTSWDIAARTGYWEAGITWVPEPGRYAHLYVLAHHPIFDDTADHRNADQWRFYIIPAGALPNTKRISRRRVERLVDAVAFSGLRSRVESLRISGVSETGQRGSKIL